MSGDFGVMVTLSALLFGMMAMSGGKKKGEYKPVPMKTNPLTENKFSFRPEDPRRLAKKMS